jgi:hypothetical protein
VVDLFVFPQQTLLGLRSTTAATTESAVYYRLRKVISFRKHRFLQRQICYQLRQPQILFLQLVHLAYLSASRRYLGLVPLEKSSGNRRRLGHITKQGSSILRFLLVQAAQAAVRSVPEWRSKYFHLMQRRGRNTAKVAMARRLAVRLYWMWRRGWNYEQLQRFGSHAGEPENRYGAQ